MALSNALFEVYARLRNNEFSEDCQENVIDRLTPLGFNLNDFVSYLERGAAFYNGTTSQAPAAGTVTTLQAANAGYGQGATVADVFANNANRRQTNALTSITSRSLLIFIRPGTLNVSQGGNNGDNFGLLFHEALHGYGGSRGGTSFFDADLQDAFGLSHGASQNISDYIQEHCF